MGFDPALVQSLKAATAGTLKIGTGRPGDVRVVYSGPGAFTGYFSAARRLTAESVVAKWGKAISLKTMSLKSPTLHVSGSRIVVKPAGSVAAVRLWSAQQFANLSRASDGTYAADIPAEMTGAVRVVVMDAHFNVWERVVRG
jgi:hypothetical protein